MGRSLNEQWPRCSCKHPGKHSSQGTEATQTPFWIRNDNLGPNLLRMVSSITVAILTGERGPGRVWCWQSCSQGSHYGSLCTSKDPGYTARIPLPQQSLLGSSRSICHAGVNKPERPGAMEKQALPPFLDCLAPVALYHLPTVFAEHLRCIHPRARPGPRGSR